MGKMDSLFDGSDAHTLEQSLSDDINTELLDELKKAHSIIRNALNVMTMEQKTKWTELNNAQGLVDFGTTRANEREAVIKACETAGV